MSKITFPIKNIDSAKLMTDDILMAPDITFEKGHAHLAGITDEFNFVSKLNLGHVIRVLDKGHADIIIFAVTVTPERLKQLVSLQTSHESLGDFVIAIMDIKGVILEKRAQLCLLAPTKDWIRNLTGYKPKIEPCPWLDSYRFA